MNNALQLEPNGWSIGDANALVREIDAELAEREANYPRLIAKGRMNKHMAEQLLAIVRDIRADLLFAFAPLGGGELRGERIDPAIAWRSKVQWINRELASHRERDEELINKGRLDRAKSQRAIGALEQLRRLYWGQMFMWEPETGSAAETYLRTLRATDPNAIERMRELRQSELARAFRQTVREHVAAVELEADSQRQGELVA